MAVGAGPDLEPDRRSNGLAGRGPGQGEPFAAVLGMFTVRGPKPRVTTDPGQELITPGIEKPCGTTNIQPVVLVTPGIEKPATNNKTNATAKILFITNPFRNLFN